MHRVGAVEGTSLQPTGFHRSLRQTIWLLASALGEDAHFGPLQIFSWMADSGFDRRVADLIELEEHFDVGKFV